MKTLNEQQLMKLDLMLNSLCVDKTCKDCEWAEIHQEPIGNGLFRQTRTCFLNELQTEIIRENDRRLGNQNPIDAALKEIRS